VEAAPLPGGPAALLPGPRIPSDLPTAGASAAAAEMAPQACSADTAGPSTSAAAAHSVPDDGDVLMREAADEGDTAPAVALYTSPEYTPAVGSGVVAGEEGADATMPDAGCAVPDVRMAEADIGSVPGSAAAGSASVAASQLDARLWATEPTEPDSAPPSEPSLDGGAEQPASAAT
jgi:hypothetical protein